MQVKFPKFNEIVSLTLPDGSERSGQVLEARGAWTLLLSACDDRLTFAQATEPWCRYERPQRLDKRSCLCVLGVRRHHRYRCEEGQLQHHVVAAVTAPLTPATDQGRVHRTQSEVRCVGRHVGSYIRWFRPSHRQRPQGVGRRLPRHQRFAHQPLLKSTSLPRSHPYLLHKPKLTYLRSTPKR